MTNVYVSPFAERYSSKDMLYLFSADKKFRTWRKLWIALAEAEKKLGLPITDAQVRELKKRAEDIDYRAARKYEESLKHDVMAHIRAYGDQCPGAKRIIHLGATSAYVVDNTDLLLLAEGYDLVEREVANVVAALAKFAETHAAVPTVAFTHFQPAQFTTVGKRACLWIQDLLFDLDELAGRRKALRFLGVKGTTGTQASFLALFEGDEHKVKRLDQMVALAMGFSRTYAVSGQTYSRKIDAQAQATLSGVAQSAHKFANDLRLLQHLREIQEPFDEQQVGSSAMAYKRNPMKSERMTSLARLVLSLETNAAFTSASQWFERTLDDSAGKRIALPESFLAVDAILQLYLDVASRLVVNPQIIEANVKRELPDIASENLLMEAVKAGGDRQELHEVIRRHKMESKDGDLLDRLVNDRAFRAVKARSASLRRPEQYVGRSASQVREFLEEEVEPRLKTRRKSLGLRSEVRV
ncbi:MAG TPA: adenylosuccinate lyase [Planctomycetota bacterium]|jgi:adenylosuccinate lyase|nr:adenylosuccinate lyase [Planctomycetota bacterium]